jgi:hypothetical protein
MSKEFPQVYRYTWQQRSNMFGQRFGPVFLVIQSGSASEHPDKRHWFDRMSLEPLLSAGNMGEWDMETLAGFIAEKLTEFDKEFTPRGPLKMDQMRNNQEKENHWRKWYGQ